MTNYDKHNLYYTKLIFFKKEPLSSIQICNKYNLKIRGGFDYKFEGKNVISCIGSFYDKNVNIDFFSKNIEKIKSYDICDLMTHPAFIDNYLLNSTSYSTQRVKEHEILISQELKELLKENEIDLVNYKDI